MDSLLQIWGGGFYLLNKILFAVAEGQTEEPKRRLRISGWSVYLLGVPAWVIILLDKHDWIAAAIEAGGVPAMLFGLLNVCRTDIPPAPVFATITAWCTYGSLLLGVGYSLYDYGGLSTVSQLLEMGVMAGFLLGSYLLAKKNPAGWLFFMLMNLSMSTLMATQHKPLLAVQQIISLGFVIYGFRTAYRSRRPNPTDKA